MSEESNKSEKKTLTLSVKVDQRKTSDSDQVRQSFSHGRSKSVAVEVKRKRVHSPSTGGGPRKNTGAPSGKLTDGEMETRMRALQEALKTPLQSSLSPEADAIRRASEERRRLEDKAREIKPEKIVESGNPEILSSSAPSISSVAETLQIIPMGIDPLFPPSDLVAPGRSSKSTISKSASREEEDEEEANPKKRVLPNKVDVKKAPVPVVRKDLNAPRKLNRNVLTRALEGEDEKSRSLAALKRARQKQKHSLAAGETIKISRDVIIPEFILVGELANRMAIRSADVIKALMKLGMMVTINQAIDGDTAELICTEFGHTPKRVSDADVETGMRGREDSSEDLLPRAPVVTVMGHVDHGKTSLLDALRKTDIVSGEAGGITQHIGAYQVYLPKGRITFIDTPGHAAFSQMRARGANITDIVILVVAADDGVMEQTKEAINHAKAANVPLIVAINKMDKPSANPDRVKSDLLQHGIVLEDLGGDTMSVEVSAKTGMNLDKLEDLILLQAEMLELKANPHRQAEGVVIEAKMDRGRGTVATVLIQRGSVKVGDVFIAGNEMGRVRSLLSDHGEKLENAGPSMPVEILGFNGIPVAGDEFIVMENESRAREISEFRLQRQRDAKAAAAGRGSMEQMMSQIAAGQIKELAVVIKTDVQGSLEAIQQSLLKLATEEVGVRILHGGVGAINESDVVLARASQGIIIGFNVRANPQARDLSRRDGIDIRYYSIIYDVIDEMKALMSGLLAPTLREKYLGSAEIREIFTNSKVGKVAGCYVTDGVVKRGSKVRLLRDNVVIHEGTLKTLRRFKEEAKEVKESYECGMAFENYHNIEAGDTIECFDIESIARQL